MSQLPNDSIVEMIEMFKSNACKNNHKRCSSYMDSKQKSCSYETPEKKFKSSLNDSLIVSPGDSNYLRGEVIGARSRIIELENQIQHLHLARKELELVFEDEKKSLQSQHDRDKDSISKLEARLKQIRNRESETKEELSETKAKLQTMKMDYEAEISNLKQKINELRDDIFEKSNSEEDAVNVMSMKITELETQLEESETELVDLRKRNEDLQTQLNTSMGLSRDKETLEQALQKSQMRVKELEYERSSYIEWQQLAKMQQSKLAALPELERELDKLKEDNNVLRDAVRNKLMLEEQVADQKKRLETYAGMHDQLAEAEAKRGQLESLLEEWRVLARDTCESIGTDTMLPQMVRQIIDKLRQRELILTSEKMDIESDLKSCQRELNSAKQDTDRLTEQITQLQRQQKSNESLIHRLQKKLLIVSRDRDSCRQQLNWFEKDLTINMTMMTSAIPPGGHPVPQGPSQVDVLKDRISSLEQTLDQYKDLVAKLENDLENTQSSVVPAKADQMKRLQAERDQLWLQNEDLRQRKTELEKKLESCALRSVQTEKILHFDSNPLTSMHSKHVNEIARLNGEIDRLKRKVISLEQGADCSKNVSLIGRQEIAELQEQLKSSELKQQRLREAFKTTSSEFRDVCYMLFGFKIDKRPSNKYVLSSMYAESPDDNLAFQLNSDGMLNLLETQYSNTLDRMIDLHLRHQQSIPVFLSALTLDLFERVTMKTQPVLCPE